MCDPKKTVSSFEDDVQEEKQEKRTQTEHDRYQTTRERLDRAIDEQKDRSGNRSSQWDDNGWS